ncbi:MAG: retroviral-like aspartic protease family protein [Candidatus Omnitrophica bacterium]|nr:retroviral-like aspartic protease family protein [Candidatus Omnitrophota bacterium]
MIVFPYKKIFDDFYPIIDIAIKSPRKIIETEVYVDTGASTSIFRVAIAEKLGIDYTKGTRGYTMVGDGSYIPVFHHKLPVRIGKIWIKTTLTFSPQLGADMNLLGQKDIFDRFDITFSKHKNTISFHPN